MRRIINFNTVDHDSSERIPELWEGETIDFKLNRVELSFDCDAANSKGQGKLFVTSKRVLWIGDNNTQNNSFDFDVPFITLHAISKDPQTYPKPCVYCQVDVEEDEIEQEEEEGNDDFIKEFFLIPEEEHDLSPIFEALSHAALINPDPYDEDEGNDDFVFNPNEIAEGSEQARVLDHLESVFQFPAEDDNEDGDSPMDS
jgi:nucleotide-sensitive chloride channel 1A